MRKISINVNQLQAIAELVPSPLYWLDTNHIVLGCNELTVKAIGASCIGDVQGKTPYDFHAEEFAEPIIRHNEEVMLEERTMVQEEVIRDLKTGKLRYFTVSKSPLRSDDGSIIGIVGISVEITAQKNAAALKVETLKKSNVLKYLELLASSFPVPVYWVDLDSAALGGNNRLLDAIGLANYEAGLGKTPYDLYPHEIANRIVEHNQTIIHSGQMLSQEETILDNTTGELKHFNAYKAPLRDEDGKIIGVLGTSIDITAEKLAEKIRLENEIFKVAAKEQEKFRQNANKVAHDIRSPLTCLLILAKTCAEIPEKERIALREAAATISDIANNLLNNYQRNETEGPTVTDEAREPILISPVLLQMLTEKKYQYQSLSVDFNHDFSQVGEFSWINIQPTAFKRTISNIINNAVDAFDQRAGNITLCLDANDKEVQVTIADNGRGMSPELMQKIMDQIAVTEGKVDGHGIGLTQVRETLQNNQGQWTIDSQLGVGTKITLTFPRAPSLNWIADTVELNDNDTIIILDDDRSIHMAWDLRFENILKKYPNLILKHFSTGQDVVDLFCGLNTNEKQNVFLLSDYELLGQKVNGLDIIEMTKSSRSILVTSHYANKMVQQSAIKIGTKILPKQLASDVPIQVSTAIATTTSKVRNCDWIKIDVIFVDDEQYLLDGFRMFTHGKKVDTYQNPQEFLDKVSQYHRDTKIMLDQTFANYHKKGTEIAEQLNTMGFRRLYLLSGEDFLSINFPDYLTPILKTDLEALQCALNE